MSEVVTSQPEASAPLAVAAATPSASVPSPTTQPPAKAKGHGVLALLQSLLETVVVAVFIITFLVQAFQIPSPSMERTLLIGDYLLVDKLHFSESGVWSGVLPYAKISRGDIIVFRYPIHPEQHFVKRVIGLPGDRIHLVNKQVYVNGKPLQEGYAIHGSPDREAFRDEFPQPDLLTPGLDVHWWLQMRTLVHGGELQVPADRYFVMGDNRDLSSDSRYWGFVPRQNVIGRPLVIYLSLRSGEEWRALPDDRLAKFGLLGQLMHLPRWGRTLRIVN